MISLILAEPPAGTDYAARVRTLEENKRKLKKLKQGEEAVARGESLPEQVTRGDDRFCSYDQVTAVEKIECNGTRRVVTRGLEGLPQ